MERPLAALDASARRLADLVRDLDDDAVASPAYPSEWSIAQVLSHLGSGAVISARRVDDALADSDTPDDFAQSVWDVWNAKAPRAQVDDALVADRALVDRLAALTEDERSRLHLSMGPMELDATAFVGMRLNEHVVHTWDVEVALDPDATLQEGAVELLGDSLQMIAGWTAKPTGSERTTTVRTTGPERTFVVALTSDAASFRPGDGGAAADVTMPAEALVRLVYGRLDPDHTPTAVTGDLDALAELRSVFPGF